MSNTSQPVPPAFPDHAAEFAERVRFAHQVQSASFDDWVRHVYGDLEWLRSRIAGLEIRETAAQRSDPRTLVGAVDAWGEAIMAELRYVEDVAAHGATRQELRTLLDQAHTRIDTYVQCIGGAVRLVTRRDDRA